MTTMRRHRPFALRGALFGLVVGVVLPGCSSCGRDSEDTGSSTGAAQGNAPPAANTVKEQGRFRTESHPLRPFIDGGNP